MLNKSKILRFCLILKVALVAASVFAGDYKNEDNKILKKTTDYYDGSNEKDKLEWYNRYIKDINSAVQEIGNKCGTKYVERKSMFNLDNMFFDAYGLDKTIERGLLYPSAAEEAVVNFSPLILERECSRARQDVLNFFERFPPEKYRSKYLEARKNQLINPVADTNSSSIKSDDINIILNKKSGYFINHKTGSIPLWYLDYNSDIKKIIKVIENECNINDLSEKIQKTSGDFTQADFLAKYSHAAQKEVSEININFFSSELCAQYRERFLDFLKIHSPVNYEKRYSNDHESFFKSFREDSEVLKYDERKDFERKVGVIAILLLAISVMLFKAYLLKVIRGR